jgi:hypothetical protein
MAEHYEPPQTVADVFEYLGATWCQLPRDVLDRMEMTANVVDDARLTETEAHTRAWQYNQFLEQRGLIGEPMLMSTGAALVTWEGVVADAIVTEVIVDSSLRGKQQIIGQYTGCVVDTYEGIEGRFLMHTMTVGEGDESIVVKAPYGEARLAIKNELALDTDPDRIVGDAFDTLLAVEDDKYRELAAFLLEEYEAEDDDRPAFERIRVLGIIATQILALPAHYVGGDRERALDTVLRYAFDDVDYKIQGYRVVEEFNEETADASLEVSAEPEVYEGIVEGITYVTDFDIVKNDKEWRTEINDSVQPAAVIAIGNGKAVTLPLRYLTYLQEVDGEDPCRAMNRRIGQELFNNAEEE